MAVKMKMKTAVKRPVTMLVAPLPRKAAKSRASSAMRRLMSSGETPNRESRALRSCPSNPAAPFFS